MAEKKRVVKLLCLGCIDSAHESERIIDFDKLPKEMQEFLNLHSEVRVIDSE